MMYVWIRRSVHKPRWNECEIERKRKREKDRKLNSDKNAPTKRYAVVCVSKCARNRVCDG